MKDRNFKDISKGGADKSNSSATRSFSNALPALVLLLVCALVFRDFLLGNKILLYKDIGSDSMDESYPCFVHLSDYLRRDGFPTWSFYVGMGQNLSLFTSYLLWQPVVWLPRHLIPEALVLQHLLKVIAVGLLFQRFLRLRGLKLPAALAGSLFLSFSAYMCMMGTAWYGFADEVVGFTLLLFAIEETICNGRWGYISLAVAAISLLTVAHLYLSAMFLCFYVPVRFVELYGWKPWSALRFSALLAAAGFLGVGIAAVLCLDSAAVVLNSPRSFTDISPAKVLLSRPMFGLAQPLYYITIVFRSFANDILGVADSFRGWPQYVEGNYCGIFCLLILPQVFVRAIWRERLLYALLLGLVAIPIVFPWFRYLFWLFQGDYFRTFSLFSILGLITLSMTAFSRYYLKERLSLWLLAATVAIFLCILFLPLNDVQSRVDPGVRRAVAVFLMGYAAVLLIGQIMNRQRIATWIVIGLTAIELIHFDQQTVSGANRLAVTRSELKERVGYNDDTMDVIRDIQRKDNSFFRVTKTWFSGPAPLLSRNDAMVFGYYGTMSYSSFNDPNYIKFLLAVDAISGTNPEEIWSQTVWSNGLFGRPLLSAFACEKYLLTYETPETFPGYLLIHNYGAIAVLRNPMFVPFGLTYTRYISEDVFRQLPTWLKELALFHAVVLSHESIANANELTPMSGDELKRTVNAMPLNDAVTDRRASAITISSFSQKRIEGAVRVDNSAIVLFQTPFDAGWRAFVDGRAGKIVKVDAGLLGVLLEPGEHRIELRYRPPFMFVGGILTIASLSIFGLTLWRWPHLQIRVK